MGQTRRPRRTQAYAAQGDGRWFRGRRVDGARGGPVATLGPQDAAGMPDRYGRGGDGPRIGDGSVAEGGTEAGDPADGHLRGRGGRTFLRGSVRRPRRYQGLFRGDRGPPGDVGGFDLLLGHRGSAGGRGEGRRGVR